MEDARDTRDVLVSLYREIAATRMEGIPVLNPALDVAAFGFDEFQGYRLGVLLTPWFMNLVLLPLDGEEYAKNAPQVGEKLFVNLPAGKVEFIVGYEEAIGHSLSCSLFSPVFEFEDQAAAEETAMAALAEVLNETAETGDEDPQMTSVWEGRLPETEPLEVEEEVVPSPPRDVSRRDFLRGGKISDETTFQEDAP